MAEYMFLGAGVSYPSRESCRQDIYRNTSSLFLERTLEEFGECGRRGAGSFWLCPCVGCWNGLCGLAEEEGTG